MAVTQYIGSRYVPMFAEPSQWDSTREYEPLTIVQHQGSSYTSKHFVPAGIAITDEAYWAQTGNYNAQVEQYRAEVKQFQSKVDTSLADTEARLTQVEGTVSGVEESVSDVERSVTHEGVARRMGDLEVSTYAASNVAMIEPLTEDSFVNWHASAISKFVHSSYDRANHNLHLQMSVKLNGTVGTDLTLCELPASIPYIPVNITYPYECKVFSASGNGDRDISIHHDDATHTNTIYIAKPQDSAGANATYVVFDLYINIRYTSYPAWKSANVEQRANQLYDSAGVEIDPNDFNLVVSSDWHSQWARANVIGSMSDNKGYDDHIMLGDILRERFSASTGEDAYTHWNSTLKVLGNHDVLSDAAYPDWNNVGGHWSNVDWTKTVTDAEAYERFFKNYASATGITIQPGTCWWYKDYPTKKVKIIGLYCMAVSASDRSAQTGFLNTQLSDALEKGYRVIIANHWPFNCLGDYGRYVKSNFTDKYYLSHGELNTNDSWERGLAMAVNTFISNGGRFIAWLVGHTHGDNIAYYRFGNYYQLVINVCAQIPPSTPQLYRYNNSAFELAFNGLTLKDDDTVLLTRYGANTIVKGGIRDRLVI